MEKKEYDVKKNIVFVSMLFLFLFSFIFVRLLYIQLFKGYQYKNDAIAQRVKETNLYPQRGIIFDKNLIPLTNRTRQPVILIFKDMVEIDSNFINYLVELTGYNKIDLEKKLKSSNSIIEIPIKEVDDENIKNMRGTIITNRTIRYSENNMLSHVIGYILESENNGDMGIEKSFNNILKDNFSSKKVWAEFDGKKFLIPGILYTNVISKDSSKPNSIKLTIDYHIQKEIEKIMDKSVKSGAVIVAEINSGNIVAMASRPNINLNSIEKYFSSDKMELYNRAIQVPYPPGSIFKTVVLISALEKDIDLVNHLFTCNGHDEKCYYNNKKGHGNISLREAYYKSCNSVFIQLGKKVGAKAIIETAKRLGFGKKIDIGLPEEISGSLPQGNELYGRAIENISIGQGKIEVTPLQVTQMMLSIANDGIMKNLTLIDELVNEKGQMIVKTERDEGKRVISEDISAIIKKYMEDVILKGTAKDIDISSIGGGGGKTGSAQAVLYNKETVHAWFSGYFPKKNPKYVITVLVEEGQSGGKVAAPVFEDIVKKIVLLDKEL